MKVFGSPVKIFFCGGGGRWQGLGGVGGRGLGLGGLEISPQKGGFLTEGRVVVPSIVLNCCFLRNKTSLNLEHSSLSTSCALTSCMVQF